MISSNDRSGWFGASDCDKVVSKNRSTKTWRSWWEVKMGLHDSDFTGSIYTAAGNRYEHHILRSISEDIETDGQIMIDKLLLRVNYDGWLDGTIYEVKTHRSDKDFEVSNTYWRQTQVEMYAYKQTHDDFKKLYIVSYPLYPDEYYTDQEDIEIDMSRIKFQEVKYDRSWIKSEYLPKLKELAKYLKKGKIPE